MIGRPKGTSKLDKDKVWQIDAMKEAGWRQADIAAYVDVSLNTITSVLRRRGPYAGVPHKQCRDFAYASYLRVWARRNPKRKQEQAA